MGGQGLPSERISYRQPRRPDGRPGRRQSREGTRLEGPAKPVAHRSTHLPFQDLSWGRSRVDIVVKGRNLEVPDHYRQHVAEKLEKVERYDQKIIRVDVELFHERNPRQSDHCQRVEITCSSRGPVVRAEACASDFYSALDCATNKLDARLRRVADRRRVHRGRRAPVSVAVATSKFADYQDLFNAPDSQREWDPIDLNTDEDQQPWHIVREKEHRGEPMTV